MTKFKGLEKTSQSEHQVGADLDLQAGVTNRDFKVNFAGFSRSSNEAIGITLSVTIPAMTDGDPDITVKLIDLAADTTQDIAITDVYRLPAGSTFNVATSGATTGTLDGVVIIDQGTTAP